MRRNLVLFGTLFFVSAILYISFMSPGLDDFDAFAFAFALDRWDTALIQVHPPGFPVYVYTAKVAQLIVQDTRLALTLVSAITGATGIVLTALVATTRNQKHAGLIAGVMLIFLPGYWLPSEIALSDIPGIASILLPILLFLSFRNTQMRRRFYLGCFFAGLSLGVRPHNAIPILLAGVVALSTFQRINRNFIQTSATGLLFACLAIFIWMIPIYQTFDGYQGNHGLQGYFERLDNHRQHIETSDSLFQQELNTTRIAQRVDSYLSGWADLLAANDHTSLLIMVSGMLVGIIRLPWRKKFTWFLMLWFIAEALKIFLLASLERPRLYLPALIPLILLVAMGYHQWRGKWRFMRLGILGMVGISLWTTLPLIQTLNRVSPPPEQATDYIQQTYPLSKGTALVVSQGSFQAAQYHLGDYKQLYTPYFNAEEWSNQVAYDRPDYLIMLDGDNIAPEIFDALTTELNYVTIDDITFERDPHVFPQHSTVRLQVMIPGKALQPDQLQLPASGIISTGNSQHSKYFSRGWYRIEDIGGTVARWTNQTAALQVTLPSKETILSFVASPYTEQQTVTVAVNDVNIGTIELNQVWGSYDITIPAETIPDTVITRIELHHEVAEYPENHNRRLAAAYRNFQFK